MMWLYVAQFVCSVAILVLAVSMSILARRLTRNYEALLEQLRREKVNEFTRRLAERTDARRR